MPLEIQENIPLALHTLYKIGGPARFFADIKTPEDFIEVLRFAEEKRIPFIMLGAGSNILVSDRGFEGLVIHFSAGGIDAEGESMKVGAGVMMARAVAESAKAGLTGFEWGIGIPGTVGGSVRGNAGCFGGEMAQVLERAQVLEIPNPKSQIPNKSKIQNLKFKILELTNAECEFSYRDSIFKRHPEWVILCAVLKLKKGNQTEILENIRKITLERTQKQDIGTQSCGCIFKNVPWGRKDTSKDKLLARFPDFRQFADKPNLPASYLIDQAGLKSKRIGKVFVSPKHANYFVNEGGATAEEVVMLIGMAKDAVKSKFGIVLEEEIQYIGF